MWVWMLVAVLVPRDTWVDYTLEELLLRGVPVTTLLPFRPLDTRELQLERVAPDDVSQSLLTRLKTSGYVVPDSTLTLGLGETYLAERDHRTFLRGLALVRMGWLDLSVAPMVKYGRSPEYPTHVWNADLSGDLFLGALTAHMGAASLTLGRTPLRIGGDPEAALMFGQRMPPLDYVFFSYNWGRYHAYAGFATADDWVVRPSDTLYFYTVKPGDIIHRYLALHGVSFHAFQGRLRINLAETSLLTGVNRIPPLYYLNPLYFYLAGHFNHGGMDNLSWDAVVRWVGKEYGLFAELYVDDAQYSPPPTGEPHQLAWLVGAHKVWGPTFWTLRYTRVDAWTYLHEGNWQAWVIWQQPVGHPLGPDFDEWMLRGTWHRGTLDWTWTARYLRKGENRPNTPWPIYQGSPWQRFPRGSGFLMGTVNHRWSGSLRLRLFRPHLRAFVEGGWTIERNADHVPGKKRAWGWLRLGMETWAQRGIP